MATVDLVEPGHRLDRPRSNPGATPGARASTRCSTGSSSSASTSNAKALAAQEAERHRIAQELHDQVGQSLTVVLLGLKQLEQQAPADLGEELALLRESARAGLDDVRRVARELRPGVLDDLAGLFERIRDAERVTVMLELLGREDSRGNAALHGSGFELRRARISSGGGLGDFTRTAVAWKNPGWT